MPKTPALGRGEVWTKAKAAAVHLHRVTVGWIDAPPETGIALAEKLPDNGWEVRLDKAKGWGGGQIDSPSQIIKVGKRLG